MKKFWVQLTKEPYNFKYFSTLTDVRKLNYTYTEQSFSFTLKMIYNFETIRRKKEDRKIVNDKIYWLTR